MPHISYFIILEKYSSGRRGSPAKGVDPIKMRGFKSLLLRFKSYYCRIGDWSSGMTVVSKTISGGSIPSSPAKIQRGVAQFGSASGLGPEGRGFKSCRPD